MKVYMEKSLPKMDEKKSLKLAGFATVREKYLENEIFSRSGKSQGILLVARESQGKVRVFRKVIYSVQERKKCTFS